MTETLGRLEEMATEAGFAPARHEDSIVVKLKLGESRHQTVFVSELGRSARDLRSVTFLSPCQRLKSGFLSGMGRRTALDLLRRNASMPFAAFALLQVGEEEMLCVRSTQLLETMDLEEFRASCDCVARFADAYEAELGKDEY